jgi:hypothetical protein
MLVSTPIAEIYAGRQSLYGMGQLGEQQHITSTFATIDACRHVQSSTNLCIATPAVLAMVIGAAILAHCDAAALTALNARSTNTF